MREDCFLPGTPLPFEQCENFRELGGYCGLQGKRIRRGLFYRTPALANLQTPADLERFRALGIRVVMDFRSTVEREAMPDPQFDGISYEAVSALTARDGEEVNFDLAGIFSGGETAMEDMLRWVEAGYTTMPFGNEAYRRMFAHIVNGDLPLLFHCTAGKDRTGIAAALILRTLGVSREDILRDYMITNDCRARGVSQVCEMLIPHFPPERARALAQTICGVRRENLERALDAIDDRYADFDAYLAAECGVSAEQAEHIRALCLA